MYQWGYDFFGLTPSYRKIVHQEIFLLCHHSNGFIQSDVYNMPVHLRKFYLNQLIELREKENKAQEDAHKQVNRGV